MLQKDSTLTLSEIKNILAKSSSLYPYPNNYVGYGVPDCYKIIKLIENPDVDLSNSQEIKVSEKKYTIETNSNDVIVFHKKNETIVFKQEWIKNETGTVVIKPRRGEKYSTVVIDNKEVYEIIWE
jgi:hypothetical protein